MTYEVDSDNFTIYQLADCIVGCQLKEYDK